MKIQPLHILHHDEGHIVQLAYVVYSNNIGMVELGDGLRFSLQTLPPVRPELEIGQDFDRHLPI